MAAMLLRVRVWVRRRLPQLVVTAAIIGVTAGLAMGVAAGTRRTDSAPDRYTAQSGGDPDLEFVQLSGPPLTERVAKMPGVTAASSMAFVTAFLVSPKDGTPLTDPSPFAGDSRLVGTRIVEGRFADPTVPDEFTVNRSMATLLRKGYGTRLGDRFRVASYDQEQVAANAFDNGKPPRVPQFTATLVGITSDPTDFDDPSPTITFSPAFLHAHPTVGVVQTIIAARLQPGTNPGTLMDAVHNLPNGTDAYTLPTRIVSADDRRAVGFQVTALWFVAAVTVVAAAIVVLQMISRTLRITDGERSSLAALGWRPKDIFAERALEGGILAAIAVPVAATLCFALTALFPLGVLRAFEPDSGPRVDWTITLYGIIATSAVVLIGSALAVRRRTSTAEVPRVGRLEGALAASGAGMPLVTGAHLITSGPHGGRRSLSSLSAGAVGLAGLVACAVVGLSLTAIVEQPARWGVNYDQLFGNPFVPVQRDIVTPIVHNADVAAVTGANIGSLTINGHDISTFAVDAVKGDILPTTLDGRPPWHAGSVCTSETESKPSARREPPGRCGSSASLSLPTWPAMAQRRHLPGTPR
jgi:hypothetical protein